MTENTPYLIAGLGNPGPDYRQNRHNAGFMVADTLSEMAGIPIRRVEFRALIGKGDWLETKQNVGCVPQLNAPKISRCRSRFQRDNKNVVIKIYD